MLFQSTRPVWGATMKYFSNIHTLDISIHAPRVGRDRNVHSKLRYVLISIHAPRVGRDSRTARIYLRAAAISIHAPRVGRDDDDMM